LSKLCYDPRKLRRCFPLCGQFCAQYCLSDGKRPPGFHTGVWDAYPISSVLNSLKNDGVNTYVTASSDKPELTSTQVMVDWLLEIPTIVALLIALSSLLAFYGLVKIVDSNRSIATRFHREKSPAEFREERLT
jgi:hypothetical protein